MNIRKVNEDDFYKGHLELYKQLSRIEPENISFDQYKDYISSLSDDKHQIYILEHFGIIGTVTLFIEKKLIHNLRSVAHIEDVVIDDRFRNKGYGVLLITYIVELVKTSFDCYKIILDCDESNEKFYVKCGFKKKGIEMALYLD